MASARHYDVTAAANAALLATEFGAGDAAHVHLVGSVEQPHRPVPAVEPGQREVVADAGRAVHLDRAVDDVARHLRSHRLDHRDLVAGFLVAVLVDGPGRLVDTAAGPGRSRCGTAQPAAAPHPARPAACRTRCACSPGRPSTPARARPRRSPACSGGCDRDRGEPARWRSRCPPRRAGSTRAPGRCRRRSRSARAGPASRTPAASASIDTPGVSIGNQDHRLLLMARGVGIGAAHHDEDLAPRIGGTGDPPLAAVDDVVAAVAQHGGLDVAGVAGGHRGLGHRERAADLAVQQRLEPLLALLLGGEQVQGLHVAGVGRRAVESPRAPAPCSSRTARPAARTRGWSAPTPQAGTGSTGPGPWRASSAPRPPAARCGRWAPPRAGTGRRSARPGTRTPS